MKCVSILCVCVMVVSCMSFDSVNLDIFRIVTIPDMDYLFNDRSLLSRDIVYPYWYLDIFPVWYQHSILYYETVPVLSDTYQDDFGELG